MAATESVNGYNQITHSFAVPVSPAMSPSTTVVVYAVSNNIVLSDSVTVPVDGIARNQVFLIPCFINSRRESRLPIPFLRGKIKNEVVRSM